MSRPIGVTALAVLAFLQGLYTVYVTLIYLGIVGFDFVGRAVRLSEAHWGQAILSGVLAAVYFAVSVGFWRVRVWAWMYGLLIAGFDVVWLLISVLGPDVTLETVLIPVLLDLAIFAYLFWPHTREAFVDSEYARLGAMGPRPAPPADPVAPPAPTTSPPTPPSVGSTTPEG